MDNEQAERITKKITVFGIVQGVGFRPTVYRMAKKHHITGTVRNLGGQVEIITRSTREDFREFLQELKENQDKDYEILHINIEDIENINEENINEETINEETINEENTSVDKNLKDRKQREYKEFRIIESDSNDRVAIIPPDLSICPKCERELFNKSDRRYENPFISCMACGPRYTIIEELPYDRDNTTMKDFSMCRSCQEEYTLPDSRRFHAQTISCHDCGPYLLFHELNNKEAFDAAVKSIESGKIIAVKGIGGYHFACSPFREDTVEQLRKLKGREEKPFAVMFASVDSMEEYCRVTDEEKALLQSKARPIVLLTLKDDKMAKSTNKGSLYCGAFLPYTALQIMLVKKCGPLIMTSANISNQPVIKDDCQMLSIESPYLDGVLYHTRRIIRSVDDSVTRILDHKPQFIRRSRGYVPYPVFVPGGNENLQIFAAGGDLKAAYCLYKKENAYVSQYFGDLEENTVLEEYKTSVTDLSRLLKIKPDLAVCDMHPKYYSAGYAGTLGIPTLYVQHHHAHIASVMAEHNLKEKVIGVAFDGTGYGTDGNIWGGEFLICEGAEFIRAGHLDYTPMIGGDSSMKDGKKTATCFLINNGLEQYIEDDRSAVIQAALKNHMNTVLTSSMGRLFDAMASILYIQDENRYEGECAIKFEKEAVLALRKNIVPAKLAFAIRKEAHGIIMDPKPVLETICRARHTEDKGSLALGFHYALAGAVLEICQIIRTDQKISTVALSGGVFQNTVLTEQLLKILRENNFNVYINRVVPPGDGSISLGQTFIGIMKELKTSK